MRVLTILLSLLLMVTLTACPRPLVTPTGPLGASNFATSSDRVSGTVDFGRRIQADVGKDVMPGSVISLIDVQTGATLSTARSDAQGNFVLYYSNGFKPEVGKLYYFEAVKGLDGGTGQFNAIGADAVRVRTIASYGNGGWVSLTSSRVGFHIPISPMTTALSVAVSLRSTTGEPIPANTLFGSIRPGWPDSDFGTPDSVVPPNPSLVQPAFVYEIYALVVDALSKERDPLRWIRLAPDSLHDAMLPDLPFSFIGFYPTNEAMAGEAITLVGSNFSGNRTENEVYFTTANGVSTVPAEVLEVSVDGSRLKVRVPLDAINGPVTLVIGDKRFVGPTDFRLSIRDGHSVVDLAGRIYVANEKTIARIEREPDGRYSVSTVITEAQLGMKLPKALTFYPGDFAHLYVALGGNQPEVRKISVVDPANGSAYNTSGTVANPGGMAFRVSTGDLYLSDTAAGALYRIPAGGGALAPVDLSAPLAGPRGLSFGPDGKLYVANSTDGTVVAIDLDTTPATVGSVPFATGLATPWGVAFDNRGSFYVTNNKGNSIFVRSVTSGLGQPLQYGDLTSFASIPSPAGLDADSSGYLYVADNASNGVYRVNQRSESVQIGFGISSPTSVWADDEGLFVLTDAGRLLKIEWGGVENEKLTIYAEGLTGALGLVRHDTNGDGKYKDEPFYTVQRSLKALTRIYSDGSTAIAMAPMNPWLWSSPTLSGNKLAFRRLTSDVNWKLREFYDTWSIGLGQVDEFDLANLAAPPRQLKGMKRKPIAVAADLTTAEDYKGVYYILDGDGVGADQNVFTLERFHHDGRKDVHYHSKSRTFFANNVERARMVNPQDIAVASDGKIWIADYEADAGSGALLVFNRNGTLATSAQYPGGMLIPLGPLSKPARLAMVGDHMMVSNHVADGDVTFFDNAGDVIRRFKGFDRPLGATVSPAGDLYVQAGDHAQQIYKIPSYVNEVLNLIDRTRTFTAPELTAKQYYTLPQLGGKIWVGHDIDWDINKGGLVMIRNGLDGNPYGKIHRYIEAENRQVEDFAHYSYFHRLSRTRNNKLLAPAIYGEVLHTDYGSHSAMLYQAIVTRHVHNVNAIHYPPNQGNAMAVVLQDSSVTYSSTYNYAFLIETATDGTWEKTYNVSNLSAMVHGPDISGNDYVYVARSHGNGVVQRWTSRKKGGHPMDVPANEMFSDLSGTANYTGSRTVGLAFRNGKLYQSLLDYHVVREIDPAIPGADGIKVFSAGLSKPEL